MRQQGVEGQVADQGLHAPSEEAAATQLQAICIKKGRSGVPECLIFQEKLENLIFAYLTSNENIFKTYHVS